MDRLGAGITSQQAYAPDRVGRRDRFCVDRRLEGPGARPRGRFWRAVVDVALWRGVAFARFRPLISI